MLKLPAFAPCSGARLSASGHPPSSPARGRGTSSCSCIPRPSSVTAGSAMDNRSHPYPGQGGPRRGQPSWVVLRYSPVMPLWQVAALVPADGTAGTSLKLVFASPPPLHPCPLSIPALFLSTSLLSSSTPRFSPSAFILSPPPNLFFSPPRPPLPAPHHPSPRSPSLLLRRRSMYWEC